MVLGWGGSRPTLDAHSLKEHSRKSDVKVDVFENPTIELEEKILLQVIIYFEPVLCSRTGSPYYCGPENF